MTYPADLAAKAPELLAKSESRLAEDRAAGRGLKLLVVGTGRCGSVTVSRYLGWAGMRAGHETVFSDDGYAGAGELEIDVSWLAVPFAHLVDCPVYHLVRHPAKTIQSFLDIRFFADPEAPFVDYANRFMPFSGDEYLDAIRFYVEWNQACEAVAVERYRLEELETLLRSAHTRLRPGEAYRGHEGTGKVTNRKQHRKGDKLHRFRWNSIPDPGLRRELEAMAERYGFAVG